MEERVFKELSAIARLKTLHIDPEVVRKAVLAGELARDTCSQHDPVTLPGTLAYGRAIREFRDGMIPRGWTILREHNLELTVSPDRGVCDSGLVGL